MAFKNSPRKSGSDKGNAFGAGMGAMSGFGIPKRPPVHTPQPNMTRFASSNQNPPRHLREQYNPQINTAANIVGHVSRSIISSSMGCHHHNSFGNAMGNALGGAIGSAIVMAVGSKIQEKQEERYEQKEAERLAAIQAAQEAERAKKEAAFHAMNKNMANYDAEAMVHMMDGAGLTQEEREKYPLECPHCLGVPDGTRYCPYCGGKLV